MQFSYGYFHIFALLYTVYVHNMQNNRSGIGQKKTGTKKNTTEKKVNDIQKNIKK